MTINWDMPIEWSDGTPAWLDYQEPRIGGMWQVHAAEKPSCGVSMATGKNGHTKLVEGHESFLRNVDLPVIRFPNGELPIRGTFINKGQILRFWTATGGYEILTYSWPHLTPMGSSPKIEIISRRKMILDALATVEKEEMEEQDIYGLF